MDKKLEYSPLDSDVAEYLKKNFTTPLVSGYIKYKDCVLVKSFEKVGDLISQMEVRDDDIWVCSFPKCGTTWTQEMVWCLGNNLDFKTAKEKNLYLRFPFLEHSITFDHEAEFFINDPKKKNSFSHTESIHAVNNLPSPRFIKTHLPFNLLPEKLQNNSTNAKIIYVTRNPRDACISYYHHVKLFEGYKVNFETFCDVFLKGYVTYGPFWNHVLKFYEQRSNPNLLIIRYEDMKEDLESVVYKVANFMKKTIDKDGLKKLLDHLSFENMKHNKAVNYDSLIESIKSLINNNENGSFIRSGMVGEWKNKMDSTLLERFKEWEGEYLKDTDFSFSV